MPTGGLPSKRLPRVRDVLLRCLDAGFAPGALAAVARRGAVHVDAAGTLAFEGAGSMTAMAPGRFGR